MYCFSFFYYYHLLLETSWDDSHVVRNNKEVLQINPVSVLGRSHNICTNIQCVCVWEALPAADGFTFETARKKSWQIKWQCCSVVLRQVECYLLVSPGDRPRKLYAERALNLPLGAELITGNMWYCCQTFVLLFTLCHFLPLPASGCFIVLLCNFILP